MKLALFGTGRMGSATALEAERLGHTIVLTIASARAAEAITAERLGEVDAAIDFTRADAVLGNIERCLTARVPIVVGTTGWSDSLGRARRLVEERGGALVWGANFSIGMQLFATLVREAARRFSRFPDYDPYVSEQHHAGKRDAPSGTANRLADILIAEIDTKRRIVHGDPGGPMPSDALHVSSLRAGHAFGRHTVGFDGSADAIELTHTARGRAGFAQGALLAARWVQERRGFHEFADVFEEEER